MTISIVQSNGAAGNPPNVFGSPVTVGNTIFIVAASYNTAGGNVTTSSPTLGGAAVSGSVAFFNSGSTNGVNSASASGNVAYIGIWMLPDVQASGQTSVSYTVTNAAGSIGSVIYEVSGMGNSPALDQSSSGSSISATTADSGATGGITASPELILGAAMIFSGAGAGHPSGFTFINPSGATDLWAGYQIALSSGGTFDWQQTSAGTPWSAAIVTVPGTPPPPPPAPVVYVMRTFP